MITLISRVMMPKLLLHFILLLVASIEIERDQQQPTMSVPRLYIDIIDVIGERWQTPGLMAGDKYRDGQHQRVRANRRP